MNEQPLISYNFAPGVSQSAKFCECFEMLPFPAFSYNNLLNKNTHICNNDLHILTIKDFRRTLPTISVTSVGGAVKFFIVLLKRE